MSASIFKYLVSGNTEQISMILHETLAEEFNFDSC